MYLTQINMIRGLTKAEYFQLRELCFFSNCLYNFALYNVRQQFFEDKTYLHFSAHSAKSKVPVRRIIAKNAACIT